MKKLKEPDRALRRSLGARFKARRERLGLSLREVGRRACVSDTTVWALERGQIGLALETAIALARALGVRPAWFFRDVK